MKFGVTSKGFRSINENRVSHFVGPVGSQRICMYANDVQVNCITLQSWIIKCSGRAFLCCLRVTEALRLNQVSVWEPGACSVMSYGRNKQEKQISVLLQDSVVRPNTHQVLRALWDISTSAVLLQIILFSRFYGMMKDLQEPPALIAACLP